MDLFGSIFGIRELYFDMLDRMKDAVYVCDIDGRLIYLNKAAEHLDGVQLKNIKGKTTFEVYGLSEGSSPMLKALKSEIPIVDMEFSYYINGKEIVQICNSGPIYESGKLMGAYTIQKDLTDFRDILEENIALQKQISFEKSKMSQFNSDDNPFGNIIGDSIVMRDCVRLAERSSMTNSSVMLVGATGSGKELFAHAIHNASDRKKKPFLALNCATIPESLIEGILFGTVKGVYTGAVEKEGLLAQAKGGTVFLDEINSMPLSSQAKLLRVLEEKKIMKLGSDKEVSVDFRIISSTNENPGEAIRLGHIREDLYYRLSVIQVTIPPLESRKEDIDQLVDYFLKRYNEKFGKNVLGIDRSVRELFMSFKWPGNVRQLRACMESAMNFTENGCLISITDLPRYLFDDIESTGNRYATWTPTGRTMNDGDISMLNEDYRGHRAEINQRWDNIEDGKNIIEQIQTDEKNKIIMALKESGGNIAAAAKSMGLSRQTLHYRLKKYGLK